MTRHLPFASTLLLAFLISFAPAASAGERPLKGGASKPDVLYHNYCSVCHGDRGDGNSRAKNSLVPPPKDFTRAPELTRDTMITIITHGKPGTAMMAWKSQLDDKE
ncbi:MAG TPA: cytochrome c, partial [Azonexus sp.]|nr:cytochrome c [Azonexus sp.]